MYLRKRREGDLLFSNPAQHTRIFSALSKHEIPHFRTYIEKLRDCTCIGYEICEHKPTPPNQLTICLTHDFTSFVLYKTAKYEEGKKMWQVREAESNTSLHFLIHSTLP